VRWIRSLEGRRGRAQEGAFFAEGIRLAIEAFQSAHPIQLVVVSLELLRSTRARDAVREMERAGVHRLDVTATVFRGLAGRENPQGIGVVCRTANVPLSAADPELGLCWIALTQPQDPGNVGAIIRTCDAVGAAGVILLDDSVDPYDSRAVRASMGSIFSQSIVRASTEQLRNWADTTGSALVAVTGEGGISYRSYRFSRPVTLVLGSEREGLAQAGRYDATLSIPMTGRADSLNLAVAAGIVLYEVYDQLVSHAAG
jgi:RNA methyltransferase, TrmH family